MAGELVPLVMIPRFTSYVGAAEYVTVGLDVRAFAKFTLAFWRGPLIGVVANGAGFELLFETSEDNDLWTPISGVTAIDESNTSADGHTVRTADLTQPFLRARLTVTEDTDDVVAMTCWATGNFERRQAN